MIEALKTSGVFRAFVPKRFGGYEIDLDLFVDVGLAVSEACPSTGWVTTFYMEHNWLLQTFSPELQEQVFTRQPFVLAPGLVNPKEGTATPKGDGYELSGHWKFGTGIVHADWVLLSARVTTEPDAAPRMFLLRPDAIEVKDTWHVDGMVATGSHDIIARAVPVPERHVSLREPPALRAGRDAPYLVRIPVLPMLALTAAIPALGAARRAVELFGRLVRERVPFGTHKLQSQRASAQIRLANTLTAARAAETVLRAVARDVTDHARGRRELSPLDQLLLRLALAHVVRDARSVVRDVARRQRRQRALPRPRAAAHPTRRADDQRAHRLRRRSRRRAVRARAARDRLTPPSLKENPCPGCDRFRATRSTRTARSSTRSSSAIAIRSHLPAPRPARPGTGGPCSRTSPIASITPCRASRSTGAASESSRRRLRELGQLRAGYARGSKFVFSQHCKAARGVGLSEEQVQAIKSWQVATCFSPLERAVLAYTDCLVLEGGRVPDGVFDALKAELSDVEILEASSSPHGAWRGPACRRPRPRRRRWRGGP